jgi:hypothetical protein
VTGLFWQLLSTLVLALKSAEGEERALAARALTVCI